MKHRAVVVGFVGMKIVYFDIPKEEAVKRWLAEEGNGKFGVNLTPEVLEARGYVKEFEFTDKFQVYDAWEI